MLPFSGPVFAEKTCLPPNSARVETDQIGQIRSPCTLEEGGRLGSETNPGATYRCVSIVAVAMAKIVRDGEPEYSQQ